MSFFSNISANPVSLACLWKNWKKPSLYSVPPFAQIGKSSVKVLWRRQQQQQTPTTFFFSFLIAQNGSNCINDILAMHLTLFLKNGRVFTTSVHNHFNCSFHLLICVRGSEKTTHFLFRFFMSLKIFIINCSSWNQWWFVLLACLFVSFLQPFNRHVS